MAENTTPKEGDKGFIDIEKQNADVARKLAEQDILAKPSGPEDFEGVQSALDKLAEEKSKTNREKADLELDPPAPDADVEAKAKADADKVAADKAAADKLAAEKAAGNEEHTKRAEELFKDVPGLPPNASPKSSEAFSAVKIKAAQEVAAREAEVTRLTKELSEAQEKLKNPVPPEIDAELKAHREWRAKIDVESDPKFLEFNKTIASAQEFIYAQLKKSPAIKDDVIEQIKKYGGPENVKMEKIFEAIADPTLQRLVESKIADIEMAKFNKEEAIKSAKANISQYIADRQKQSADAINNHNTVTRQQVENLAGQLEWLKPKTADAKADEVTKKAVKEHNEFVEKINKDLSEWVTDDSPQMRAVLLAGAAQLLHERRINAPKDGIIERLTKENKELSDKLSRFKAASVTRLRESGAPPSGNLPTNKPQENFSTPAGQALDDLAKSVMEEKARAAGNAA